MQKRKANRIAKSWTGSIYPGKSRFYKENVNLGERTVFISICIEWSQEIKKTEKKIWIKIRTFIMLKLNESNNKYNLWRWNYWGWVKKFWTKKFTLSRKLEWIKHRESSTQKIIKLRVKREKIEKKIHWKNIK